MKKSIWFAFVAIFTLLDQLSKLIFVQYWPEHIEQNTGSAFSFPIPGVVSITLAVVVSAGILYYFLVSEKKKAKYDNWIGILIVAGAIGNMIDRIRLGYVIDFIDLGFWPVFNVADVYLSLGAIMVLWFYVIMNYNVGKGKDK